MATTTKLGVSLKLTYDLGMEDDKKITKSKTINNIRINATDVEILAFSDAMQALQEFGADLVKVENTGITA